MILSKLIRSNPMKNGEQIIKTAAFLSTICSRNHSISSTHPAYNYHATNHQLAYSCLVQRRLYADHKQDNIKNFNLNLSKRKQLLTDNIEQKRIKVKQQKEHIIQGIRDKKSQVQKKVREMEEIVERENIVTIPNILCVARSVLAPYIGYVIIQGDYQLAIGLLAFAGITDLVSLQYAFVAKHALDSIRILIFPIITFNNCLIILLILSVGWLHCSYMDVTSEQTWIVSRSDG